MCLPRSSNVLHNSNRMFQYISISHQSGESIADLDSCTEFFYCMTLKIYKKFVTFLCRGDNRSQFPSKKYLPAEFSDAAASYFLLISVTVRVRSLAVIDNLQIFFRQFYQNSVSVPFRPTLATCPVHLTLLDLITLTLSGKTIKL